MIDDIHVRFVRADHSLEGDGGSGQGVVTNPNVYLKDKESFIAQIQNLVASCNKAGDDLSIHSLYIGDVKNEVAVAPSDDTKHFYKTSEAIIATVARLLEVVKNGKNPKYDFAREILKRNPISLV